VLKLAIVRSSGGNFYFFLAAKIIEEEAKLNIQDHRGQGLLFC